MAGYATPAWSNGSSPALNATNLLALGQAVELAQHPFGTCSTAAATAAKTVTIDFSGTLALFTGLRVSVKFTNGNSAANPTLNVNSTGAIPIMSVGTTNISAIRAGAVLDLIYDGTNWIVVSIDGGVKANIETGSYTGNGQYGVSHPTSLNFSIVPAFVFIKRSGTYALTDYGFFVQGDDRAQVSQQNTPVTWSGKTMSWYTTATGPQYQLNSSGGVYNYIAIG